MGEEGGNYTNSSDATLSDDEFVKKEDMFTMMCEHGPLIHTFEKWKKVRILAIDEKNQIRDMKSNVFKKKILSGEQCLMGSDSDFCVF